MAQYARVPTTAPHFAGEGGTAQAAAPLWPLPRTGDAGEAPLRLPVKTTFAAGAMFLYWSALSSLSFLELARTTVGLSVLWWVWFLMLGLALTLAAWGVLMAHTTHGPDRGCFESLNTLLGGTDGWNPVVLQWMVYAAATAVPGLQCLALYLRHSDAELALLQEFRWSIERPPELDVVLIAQWQSVHVLMLVSWLVTAVSGLMMRIHVAVLLNTQS